MPLQENGTGQKIVPAGLRAAISVLGRAFGTHDAELSERLRMADYNILPGVMSDEGDDWPALRGKIFEPIY